MSSRRLIGEPWRYLEIEVVTAAEPLQLDGLRVVFTAYPFSHKARFTNDDATLRDGWDVGRRTARLRVHDAYRDTPYWERLQHVGDTRIQTLISYTNAGDDRLARQAMEAFHNSLLPEGIEQSRYPSRHLQVIQNFLCCGLASSTISGSTETTWSSRVRSCPRSGAN